jgi:tetratricopeptide (TPR) repeat protein
MHEWIKGWLLGGLITSTALCLPAQQQDKKEPGPQAADQAAEPPAVKESVSLDPERQKKVDTWIQELGNSSFRIRKKASRALWELMDEALPALEKAASGDDPEVTISAQELIDKIKAGIAPGMSDEIIDQVDRFRTTRSTKIKFDIAARIFELKNGERVVLNLLRNESNEYTRRGIVRTIAEKLYTKIGVAILNDQARNVDLLLQIALISRSDKAYRDFALWKMMNGGIETEIARLEALEKPADPDVFNLVYLHRTRGNLPRAIRASEKINNDLLRKSLLFEAGDWQGLAGLYEKQIEKDELEWLGYRAAFNRLAGNKDVFRQCVDRIKGIGMDTEEETWFAAEALLLNDVPDEAEKILMDKKQYGLLTQLLMARMKFDEVLKVIESDEEPNEATRKYYEKVKAEILVGVGMDTGGNTSPEPEQNEIEEVIRILLKGHHAARIKNWARAAAIYNEAQRVEPSSSLATYFYGWALSMKGEEENGQIFMDRATVMPLADERARFVLIAHLEDLGLVEHAAQQRLLNQVTGAFESYFVGDALTYYAIPDAIRHKQFAHAAVLAERARLHSMRKEIAMIQPRGYLFRAGQIIMVETLRQHHAGNPEASAAAAKSYAELLPNSAMEFAVELKDEGAMAAYHAAFDTAYEILSALCKKYTKAAEAHNALAWMTAICRENLEEGLTYSERAMELVPDSSEYLDTLAEVHFQLKHDAKAIGMMKRCIELDDENVYFKRQLERFQKGDRDSPAE